MHMNKKIVIRIAGSVAVATGLLTISQDWRGYLYAHRSLGGTLEILGPVFTALGLAIMSIPVAKIAAGVGLFSRKRWAWITAVLALTAEALLGIQCAVRMWFFSPTLAEIPIPAPDPRTVVHVVSMGPTFVVSIIAAISVLVLIQKPIRNQFVQAKEPA
jgi:hypothetical protein